MNTNILAILQQRISEAQTASSQSKGYPEPLIIDIVQFIDQSEKRSFAAWSRLLKISSGTLGRWFERYSIKSSAEQSYRPQNHMADFESASIEIPQGIQSSGPAGPEELILLRIGAQAQAHLRLDQLAMLISSSALEVSHA